MITGCEYEQLLALRVEQTRATQLTLGKLISFFLDVLFFFFLYKWLWVFRDPDVDFHFIDSEQSHRFFSEPAILFIIFCLLCTAEPKLQIICDQHLKINELMNKALKMAENESLSLKQCVFICIEFYHLKPSKDIWRCFFQCTFSRIHEVWAVLLISIIFLLL